MASQEVGSRQSLMLTREQLDDLSEQFDSIDVNGDGSLSVQELGPALETIGYKLPAYEVRDLIQQFSSDIDEDKLSFEGFKKLFAVVKQQKDLGHAFKKVVTKRTNVETHGGMTDASTEGTTHTVGKVEQVAFSNWINRNLRDDQDSQKYLPLDPESRDLYNKCKDGILLCKLINKSQSGTIDERTINKTNLTIYRIHENLTLALNSSLSIGCNIINIGPDDLYKGKPHLVLGLLWQIIRIGLLSDINLHENPNLAALLLEGETLEDLMRLTPEEILIRWVNYHLAKSNCGRQIANFSGDIMDSVAYIHLLHQISPREKGVTIQAEHEPDLTQRAEKMLQESEKIGCRQFVTPQEVVRGNYKLNLAFVANLFNSFPALDKQDDIDLTELHEETREEKTYRNWMNSMGVSPFVNRLYSDLQDGLVIFQLYDIIQPGIVDWKRVNIKFKKIKIMMEKIENCNYAVELGLKEPINFSLVGIAGHDIYDGNEVLTLALVWQLMKAYTLTMMTRLAKEDGHPVVEKEIIEWVNSKLKMAGKTSSITSFNDQSISEGKVVIDLVDAVKPGSVDYKLVKQGTSDQEKLDNAKLAISMARKIGARVYALPEDIVEVKSKMVMTVFACIMIKDYQPPQQNLS